MAPQRNTALDLGWLDFTGGRIPHSGIQRRSADGKIIFLSYPREQDPVFPSLLSGDEITAFLKNNRSTIFEGFGRAFTRSLFRFAASLATVPNKARTFGAFLNKHKWQILKKAAPSLLAGAGVKIAAQFALGALVTTVPGFALTLATGALAGAIVGGIAGLRATPEKERTKGWRIKAIAKGMAHGAVSKGLLGTIKNTLTTVWSRNKEERFPTKRVVFGLVMGAAGVVLGDLVHENGFFHETFFGSADATQAVDLSASVSQEIAAPLAAFRAPVSDLDLTLDRPFPLFHPDMPPPYPDADMESLPEIVPEADATPEPVFVPPPEPVPQIFETVFKQDTFNALPDNLQDMAANFDSLSPQDQLLFCKEASYFASIHTNSYAASADLLQCGIDIAWENGLMDSPRAQGLWADMSFLYAYGKGGLAIDPEKAIFHALMAGDNPEARAVLEHFSATMPQFTEQIHGEFVEARQVHLDLADLKRNPDPALLKAWKASLTAPQPS